MGKSGPVLGIRRREGNKKDDLGRFYFKLDGLKGSNQTVRFDTNDRLLLSFRTVHTYVD